MKRADNELAFLLKYENVAWYEEGVVKILDRRIYPLEIKYVVCKTHKEVTRALKNMVTQSGGPYIAINMGMVLAVKEALLLPKEQYIDYILESCETLCNARPTTVDNMRKAVENCKQIAIKGIDNSKNIIEEVFKQAVEEANKKYIRYEKIAMELYKQMPLHGTIMTQCFGETVVGMLLKICNKNNNKIKIICAETRPYFQGSRLTASVAKDMGFDVTVICDNMPAMVMKLKKVDVFISATDAISMDGHIVNKIGTLQMALSAHYFGIPYFATGIPNKNYKNIDSVEIEERDSEFITYSMGLKITMEGVKGYYPSFDITPPKLISGIVTDKGIFSPYTLNEYYEN